MTDFGALFIAIGIIVFGFCIDNGLTNIEIINKKHLPCRVSAIRNFNLSAYKNM